MAQVIRMAGLNCADGLGAIFPIQLNAIMQEEGRLDWPLTITLPNGKEAKFSYQREQSSSIVYREVTDEDTKS